MYWQLTPYTLLLLAAAAISAALALFAWRRHSAPGAMPLALLMLAVAVWSLGYALELGSADLPTQVFWAKVEYLGIVSVPVMWLAFVLQYSGREKWLTRRNRVLLAIIPLVTLLLVWTNDTHGLIWSNIGQDTSSPFLVLDLTYGAGFWINWVYSYLLLLLGTLLLIQTLLRSLYLYRGQLIALLIGALAPWIGNALYVSGLNPFPHLDLTPFAFTLSGLAVAWGLFRYRLLDIVPVARDAVVEGMSDGVIVLDAQNRIVDLNPAAQRIIGRPRAGVIGQPAPQVLSDQPDLIERYLDVAEAQAEIVLGEGEAQRVYDLRISPLHSQRGRPTGRLVVLRDITERKQAEKEIRWRAEMMAALHETALDLVAQRALPDLLQAIVARATGLLKAKQGAIYFYRPATDDLELTLTYNLDPDLIGVVLKRGEGLSGKVLETGRPMAVDDYSHWEGRSAQYEGIGFTACVAVPISWGGHLLGVLNLLDDAPRTFSSADITLLEHFTPLAAAALEQTRLLEEERARRREAETLREATAAVTETLSLDERLRRILEQLDRVVPYDSASVQLLRDGYLEIVGGRGFPEPEAVIGLRFPVPGDNPNTMVVLERRPVILADVQASHPPFREPPHSHIRSWLGVPLIVQDRVIGILAVDSVELDHFDEGHIRLVTPFANQVAMAIENARLYEEARQRAAELRILYEVAAAAMTSVHLDEILSRTMLALQETLRPDDIAILLVEPETNELVIRASTGFPGGPKLVRRFIGVGIPGWVVQTGQPVLLADVREDKRYHACDPDTRSELCVPLQVGERVIGALNLESRRLAAFSEEDLHLVSILAGNLAAVIENARLYEESQRRLREMNSLLRISRDVTATLELNEVLRRVIEIAIATIGPAEKGTLHLLDEGQKELTVRASVGFSPATVAAARFKPGEGYTGWVFAHQQPLIIGNVKADPRTKPIDLPEVHEEKSALCVPLIVRGRAIGTLTLDNVTRYDAFTPDHLDLLTIFANQAAVAIENARLYKQAQQEIAERRRAEEVLRQYTAELEARNEELDAFAHTVAHDLKNPVALVIGFAEALEREDYTTLSDDELRHYLHTIAHNVRKMSSIIEGLLLLAEARTAEVTMEPLDTARLVVEAQRRLADMIEEYKAEIVLPETWPMALGYGPWVEEVWVNYLSNAIKYGGRPPRVELGATVQPDGMVRFWVRDNGPGLTPEEQARLFTPFAKLDRLHATGHGLGLSIVRRIVERLGGQVGVESEVGRGSVFFFTLSGIDGQVSRN